MRKSKEDMQDIVLHGMEKDNKKGDDRIIKEPSLKEQLEALDKYSKLSSTEKLKLLSWRDWSDLIRKKLSTEYRVCRSSHAQNIMIKYKARFEELHKNGTSIADIIKFVEKEYPDQYN